MTKKYALRIIERKISHLDFRLFDISFATSFLSVKTETFDLRSFYKKKYLPHFLLNFKDEKSNCYLLFLAVINKYTDYIKEQLMYITTLADSHLKILEKFPQKKFFIQFNGKFIYLLTLSEKNIKNVSQILESIDLKELEDNLFYFIFGLPQDYNKLASNLKNFIEKNILDDNHLISLSLEFVKMKLKTYQVAEEFKIFTCRFDREGIKDVILKSTFVESDKFEVMYK